MNIAERIAGLLAARHNCRNTGNLEWLARHGEALRKVLDTALPHGSGFDAGFSIGEDEEDDSNAGARIVLRTSFHHMNEAGSYDGWTHHRVTVYPSFVYTLRIVVSGPNRNDIKDYIAECVHTALTAAWAEEVQS